MSFNPQVWYQRSAATQAVFTSTWKTDNTSTGSSASNQVKLPLTSAGTYNFKVDWGDGSSDVITVWNQAQTTHTYSSIGIYQIKITGTIIGWSFGNTGDRLKILSVQKWGQLILGVTNITNAYFYGCSNLSLSSVSDVLNITGFVSFTNIFNGCTNLTTINRANEWNVSSIIFMASSFTNCTNLNQSFSNWNVSNCTNFSACFQFCTNYNQPLSSWNMSNAQLINNMFHGCSSFNQNLNGWSITACTNMTSVFLNASVFNNGLASGVAGSLTWTTSSSLQVMTSSFQGCTAFNQSIASFTTSGVTSFSNCFTQCVNFNHGGVALALNTSSATTLQLMFDGCTIFNQSLLSFSTGNVTSFASMLRNCQAFNQNVGHFIVNKATSISQMFYGCINFNNGGSNAIKDWVFAVTGNINGNETFRGCTNFNQPLDWNTGRFTNIGGMFYQATAFNQNIGAWNVSIVIDFVSFMVGKTPATFSTTNLDAIYNGWTSRALSASQSIAFGTAKHTTAATAARALLTRVNTTQAITNAVDNGSGLIRITSAGHGRTTGDKIFISGVLGTTEANGGWIITVIDANTFDLQGSAFVNTYTSAGTLRIGYGWTVVDGGI